MARISKYDQERAYRHYESFLNWAANAYQTGYNLSRICSDDSSLPGLSLSHFMEAKRLLGKAEGLASAMLYLTNDDAWLYRSAFAAELGVFNYGS